MILVTVGTEKFPFNRLMNWIDELIEQNVIQPEQEEIIIQYGSCTIVPSKAKSYSLLPSDEFETIVERARLIIAHCGEGTIDLLANINKPFILVPRSGEFKEHVDNHQVELARQLAKLNIPVATSPADLVGFLQAPQVAQIATSPTQYYAQASFLLEEQFETDSILEALTADLVSDLAPAYI